MTDDRDAASLIRAAGLMPDGPVRWGQPVRHAGPGVLVIELGVPVARPHLDLARLGRYIEHVPELHLDGTRPQGKELAVRLAQFWLPSEPVVFIGSSAGTVGGRMSSMLKTVPGDRKPAWTGYWLHFLRGIEDARVWWAATDAPEEYEDALLDTFASGVVAAERAALPDPAVVLPWATLRAPSGARRNAGIANPLVAEVREPAPPPVTRIVELPPAEADGAADEAKRKARPAPGRGVGRVAAAAGFAAQGSPKKARETLYISPDGLERLDEEIAGLVSRRPEVIKRIATAREHGDLKENAEYHAAREEQGFLEARIKLLDGRRKVAVVVAPQERGAVVEIGSRVRVAIDGDEMTWTIVGSTETNAGQGRISNMSPVGAALMNRRVGDAVTIRTPAGEVRYSVLAIE